MRTAMTIMIGIVVCSVCVAQDGWPPTGEKRLIYYGWGAPNSVWVRENWRQMDEMPFDATGVTIAIDRRAWLGGEQSTENKLGWHLFGPDRFERANFTEAIADLQAMGHARTSPMLAACIVSRGQDFGFDWFDEERWQTVLHNWALFCEIARDGGCEAIIFDPEHYGTYFFNYGEMNQRHEAGFEEYAELLRRRGQQFAQVGLEANPNLKLLMFWGHSYLALHPSQKEKPPIDNAYGLLPDFLDGMLETAVLDFQRPRLSSPLPQPWPPEYRIQFVDMCEFAYGFTRREQFLDAYHGILNRAARIARDPDLYRQRMTVGFGLWLDHGGSEKWHTDDLSQNYRTPGQWRETLQTALETTDRYVWVYSHSPRFYPPGNLPDEYLQAFRDARAAAGLSVTGS